MWSGAGCSATSVLLRTSGNILEAPEDPSSPWPGSTPAIRRCLSDSLAFPSPPGRFSATFAVTCIPSEKMLGMVLLLLGSAAGKPGSSPRVSLSDALRPRFCFLYHGIPSHDSTPLATVGLGPPDGHGAAWLCVEQGRLSEGPFERSLAGRELERGSREWRMGGSRSHHATGYLRADMGSACARVRACV